MHNFTLRGAQRCSTCNERISSGLGEPRSLKEYADRAQWINYEGYRAIFESRSNHRGLTASVRVVNMDGTTVTEASHQIDIREDQTVEVCPLVLEKFKPAVSVEQVR